MNKKGDIADFMYIMVFLLVLAMSMLICYKVINAWNSNIGGFADSYGIQASNEIEDMMPSTIDNSYLLLVIGLCIITLILASMTYFHPVFFVLFIIFVPIIILIGGILSTIYQTMADTPEFIYLSDKLMYTSLIMKYLPIIIGVFGFILAIIMYKGWQSNN